MNIPAGRNGHSETYAGHNRVTDIMRSFAGMGFEACSRLRKEYRKGCEIGFNNTGNLYLPNTGPKGAGLLMPG